MSEDSVIMSDAHCHEQTGQAASPVVGYAMAGKAASICARQARVRSGILAQGKSGCC